MVLLSKENLIVSENTEGKIIQMHVNTNQRHDKL